MNILCVSLCVLVCVKVKNGKIRDSLGLAVHKEALDLLPEEFPLLGL